MNDTIPKEDELRQGALKIGRYTIWHGVVRVEKWCGSFHFLLKNKIKLISFPIEVFETMEIMPIIILSQGKDKLWKDKLMHETSHAITRSYKISTKIAFKGVI
jgi:hypothetical protein